MISLFVCGDIVNCENADGTICSGELAELVSSSDYAVCNFEAPLTGFGEPQPKIGPHLHQQPRTIINLKSQGFDLLLLANNHIMDFGVEGLTATINLAREAGIDTLGVGLDSEAAYKPLIKEVGGYRLGMINACEAQFGVIDYFHRTSSAGYAWINHPLVDRTIIALKEKCDFVIVFSHAGLENYSIPQSFFLMPGSKTIQFPKKSGENGTGTFVSLVQTLLSEAILMFPRNMKCIKNLSFFTAWVIFISILVIT